MSIRACAVLAAPLLLVAGCGSGSSPSSKDGLTVTASFYPLQYVTQRIVGDTTRVGSLTAAGAEPHDLELTPRDVGRVTDSDLVVYLGEFQPSVDDAVATQAKDRGFDVAAAARLDLQGHEEGGHADDGEHPRDPHFWLDPTRLAAVSDAIAARLATLDPGGAATFRANAASLHADLDVLDREFTAGLATCGSRDLVTSHEAFGYLSQQYGMTQVGITGISPDQEPDAAGLAKVTDFVRANRVRTIYTETLASPAVARTVAQETGATVEVLDPIEGLTDASQGRDYLAVMRSNLANLRKGQACT